LSLGRQISRIKKISKCILLKYADRTRIKLNSFRVLLKVEAELYHADGQTDITKLTVAFRNFANAPKNFTLRHSFASVPSDAHNKHTSFP
jgi:hypothetical protein